MFKRIDHVEMVPRDLEKTISFFIDVLGFKLKERMRVNNPKIEEVVFLILNDTMIELLKYKNPVEPVSAWEFGYKSMALEVDNMERTVEYLRGKGVFLTKEPKTIGNSLRAEIIDPDGFTIELRQW